MDERATTQSARLVLFLHLSPPPIRDSSAQVVAALLLLSGPQLHRASTTWHQSRRADAIVPGSSTFARCSWRVDLGSLPPLRTWRRARKRGVLGRDTLYMGLYFACEAGVEGVTLLLDETPFAILLRRHERRRPQTIPAPSLVPAFPLLRH